MKVDPNVCIRCGACVSVCPFDAIEATDSHVRPNERCTECGTCEKICPVGAITIGAKKI
ncbi:MAG: ferredoxin [Hadesarchaea archaeon]|nr:MAG: ferredoxin [Hadesarchaea archaeon]HDI12853.1 4Fe-4S dicluster domain-containing protein [Hadesarchaea archaeon]